MRVHDLEGAQPDPDVPRVPSAVSLLFHNPCQDLRACEQVSPTTTFSQSAEIASGREAEAGGPCPGSLIALRHRRTLLLWPRTLYSDNLSQHLVLQAGRGGKTEAVMTQWLDTFPGQ